MLLGYEELTVYRDVADDEIFREVCHLIADPTAKDNVTQVRNSLISVFGKLAGFCEERGFSGDLWADYLANLLVNAENAYSYACEMGAGAGSSVKELALHDMWVFRSLFHADITKLFEDNGLTHLCCIKDFEPSDKPRIYSARIRERICELARDLNDAHDAASMLDILTDFYQHYGVGTLGLHRAFTIEGETGGSVSVVPVLRMKHVTFDDLVGYEIPKAKLIENTESFIEGRPANNCLLYGDAGTGKSTCIRALATQYYDRGLRIIQVKRDQFAYLEKLLSVIKNRGYRFIIYMDDLSFEDFETDYKYLKAVIEGGLEERPDNILIYATSNRRHLIRENFSDRDDRDEDLHRSDTMAEKLSLSQRFGVSIYFGSPDKKTFNNIVVELAKRSGIDMPEDELVLAANKWEMAHGGLSGRCARQFIDHLLGSLPEGSVT